MNLLEFFRSRSSACKPMVLATVYETVGSTYTKAGGQMLIDSDGNFCGMLSGGCLEGDLVERSRRVIDSGNAETVSYELGADDELWGLGVGCDGTMRILLQPVTRQNDYQPFTEIADLIEHGETAHVALVIGSETPSIDVGASMLFQEDGRVCFGANEALADAVAAQRSDSPAMSATELATSEGRCMVLFTRILPAPALLVLGAGLDAEPVARIARELGWRCTVYDHRPAYVESRVLPEGVTVLCAPVDELASQVVLDDFDLAIVMSHHLASDRSYLRQLAVSRIGYIGLLGPVGRRDRLVNELADAAAGLDGRLHGPAGIDLGGRGPGPIALSIIAEMQRHLSKRV
mgnify:FL=1